MGDGVIEFEFGNIQAMFEAFDKVGGQAYEIESYFLTHVCSQAGFTGAMSPIGDQIAKVGPYFTDMRETFTKRWENLTSAVATAVHKADMNDNGVSLDLSKYMKYYEGAGQVVKLPPIPEKPEFFPIDEIGGDLSAPAKGEDRLTHDSEWKQVSEIFDTVRDKINCGIDALNGIGASIQRITEESLEELIIYPLTGNYKEIQSNGDACKKVHGAMSHWGSNFSYLSGKVGAAMLGDTQLGVVAQLNVYNLVMKTIGFILEQGHYIFDGIAWMSERISVAVEKLIIRLGKKLAKVLEWLMSRVFGSWFAWARLAKDLITKGISAITDVYHDIMAIIDMIQAAIDLIKAVETWAHDMKARLEAFKDLIDVIKKLPRVSPRESLEGLSKVDMSKITATLNDIKSGLPDSDTQWDPALQGALDALPS